MNCCRETANMGVPARHRERSGEPGGPPGNRPTVPRDWFRGVPQRYVAGADTRGRTASGSERRTAISVVAVTPGREFLKYPGYLRYS
jgi:hypothetical protein